jgi:hypothetical protein
MNVMRLPIAVYTLCWWFSMAEKIGRALLLGIPGPLG